MKSEQKDNSMIKDFSSGNVILKDDEIKNCTTLELLNLKNSVFNYLKCRKIKNRNHNFITVYSKISNEINSRKDDVSTTFNHKTIIFETVTDTKPKENLRLKCNNIKETNTATISLLGKKKFYFSKNLFDINFPSFLNDKIEVIKEEAHNDMCNSSSNDDKEISIKHMKIKSKKCLNGKLIY